MGGGHCAFVHPRATVPCHNATPPLCTARPPTQPTLDHQPTNQTLMYWCRGGSGKGVRDDSVFHWQLCLSGAKGTGTMMKKRALNPCSAISCTSLDAAGASQRLLTLSPWKIPHALVRVGGKNEHNTHSHLSQNGHQANAQSPAQDCTLDTQMNNADPPTGYSTRMTTQIKHVGPHSVAQHSPNTCPSHIKCCNNTSGHPALNHINPTLHLLMICIPQC